MEAFRTEPGLGVYRTGEGAGPGRTEVHQGQGWKARREEAAGVKGRGAQQSESTLRAWAWLEKVVGYLQLPVRTRGGWGWREVAPPAGGSGTLANQVEGPARGRLAGLQREGQGQAGGWWPPLIPELFNGQVYINL